MTKHKDITGVFLSGDEKLRFFMDLDCWEIEMIITGWCFDTFGLFFLISWGCHHPNWLRSIIFHDSNHRRKAILGRSTTWPLGSEGSADLCGRWRIKLLLGKPGNFPQNPQETSKFHWLVVSNMFFIFHNIWDNPSHWRTHIFQDG